MSEDLKTPTPNLGTAEGGLVGTGEGKQWAVHSGDSRSKDCGLTRLPEILVASVRRNVSMSRKDLAIGK
jgi:hypothetical protein